MTEQQRKEIDRQVKINRIKRMLGVYVPPTHFGDPLPSIFRSENMTKRDKTKYQGSGEDIQVRIR